MNEPMLSELFVEQYNALLGVAFQLTKDEDDALDMVQDLAEAIARIDQPLHLFQNPMAYFRTCLRNARISELSNGLSTVSRTDFIRYGIS
jgi:DNA-directed RNA polymerase specialized sigma24 family protein